MAGRLEAQQIVTIAQEYLTEEKITEFFGKLNQDIGKKTEDQTIKNLFSEIYSILNPPPEPVSLWFWICFYALVIAHLLLVVGVSLSFCLLPFMAPWYIALPLMTFIFFFSTTRIECQLTNLENRMRKRVGMKRIGGFVGFYIFKPTKYVISSIRKKKTKV